MNIVEILKEKKLTISTAESITGGKIASTICDIAGASSCFKGTVVAYTKEIKCKVLGLKMEDIEKYSVYSNETVIAMALASKRIFESDIAIATSGVAGPKDDENVKAGTVYFCFVIKDKIYTKCQWFEGDRNAIRKKAVDFALTYVGESI